jgi:heat shock 70kDa protein 1/6/8
MIDEKNLKIRQNFESRIDRKKKTSSKKMAAGKVAIGIDLGTTNSCVGVWRHDRAEIIANDSGERTTPSVVAYTSDERLVGRAAVNQSARNAQNTVFGAKRLIGRRFSDESVQSDRKLWPFEVVRGDDDKPMIKVSYKGSELLVTAEEVSAAVLQKMRQTAQDFLGEEVVDAVVTVPAYFNDSQRQATKQAGIIAGLNVLRIINEPTAAAMAYGLHSKSDREQRVLIYDLGGGTLDCSLLFIESGVFEVKATSGDTHCGGEDIDNMLVDHFVREFRRQTKLDMSSSVRALRRLRTACEKAKCVLSSAVEAPIEVDSLFEGEDFYSKISRARFNEICSDFFLRCMAPVNVVLDEAGLTYSDIDEVVLVGGSTKIPQIRDLLAMKFKGKQLNCSVNPDEAVAAGAAIQASILAGTATGAAKEALLMDVTPLSLGCETAGGRMAVVVEKGRTVPTSCSKEFSTSRDNQEQVNVAIYEGERPSVAQNNLIGKFSVGGIPPMPRGKPRIEVKFDIDADGILTVSATEKTSGVSGQITVSNDAGRLSEEQINAMLEDAKRYADADNLAREVAQWRNTLESYTFGMQAKCTDETADAASGIKFCDELSDAEKDKLRTEAGRALIWLESAESNDLDALKARQQALEEIAMPISASVHQRIKAKYDESQKAKASEDNGDQEKPAETDDTMVDDNDDELGDMD